MAFTAGGRFLAGTAWTSLPWQGKGYAGDRLGRAILAGGHLNRSLWGLKTRASRKAHRKYTMLFPHANRTF